jgi:hypothetical protein
MRGSVTHSLPKASLRAASRAPTISPNSGYLEANTSATAVIAATVGVLPLFGPCSESKRLRAPEQMAQHTAMGDAGAGEMVHFAEVETASIITTRSDWKQTK